MSDGGWIRPEMKVWVRGPDGKDVRGVIVECNSDSCTVKVRDQVFEVPVQQLRPRER